MKILHHALLGLFLVQTLCLGGERPDLVPMPKVYQASNARLSLDSLAIFIEENNRQCTIAADEIAARITELGGTPGAISSGIDLTKKGIHILTATNQAVPALRKQYRLRISPVSPGPQGYVLYADNDRVLIIGSDNVGALYGAMTLRQMIQQNNNALYVAGAKIVDWPDFKIRTGVSFRRGLEKLARGEKDKMAAIREGMNWMMRFKMNHLKDYPPVDPRVISDETKKFWQQANAYAVERGIYPGRHLWSNLYGYVSWAKDRAILPPGVKSKKDWPCVYEARSYREAYYCWSDDQAAQNVIQAEADLLKTCNFKMFMYHPVDGGGLADPEFWSRRCPHCRARWKDNERWKATVHQLGMWNRIIKQKNPDIIMWAAIYPYSADYYGLRADENEDLWQQNVLDYWQNINQRLDPSIYFVTWFSCRANTDKFRSTLMGRPISFGDRHTQQMGIFSTQSRFYITDYYSNNDMMRTTGLNVTTCNWMFLFNAAEYAWNITSPGCEEFKDNMIFYDCDRDHTGPVSVIREWLPRACRLFWGPAIADNMAALYGSGIQPRYILDPGKSISIINKFRSDPLADTDPLSKKKVGNTKRPAIIVDDVPRMKTQAEAAALSLRVLEAAFQSIDTLNVYKRKVFVRYYRRAPYWLCIAQARYAVRVGDALLIQGMNQKAIAAYRAGLEQYRANRAHAKTVFESVKDIPDFDTAVSSHGKGLKEAKVASELEEHFIRKIESAETILRPRQIGERIQIAVYNGLGAKGTVEYLQNFSNVDATIISDLSLKTLNQYDCLFMLRDHSVDRSDYFQNLRTYVLKGGGGVIFEHTLCGHKRFECKTPFPEVCKYAANRYDNFDRKLFTTENTVFRTITAGTEYKNMYLDFFSPVPGKNAFVLALDKDKHIVAIAGKVGLGKVVFSGCLSKASVNNSWATEDAVLFGFNAMLAHKAIEWFTNVKLERKP